MIAVTTALVAALLRPQATDDDPPSREPPRADWIARDVEVARAVAALLDDPPDRLDAVRSAATGLREDRARDAGFGGREIELRLAGGYTTARIRVVGFSGRVGAIGVFQDCREDSEPEVYRALCEAWGGRARAASDGFHASHRNGHVLRAYREEVERVLGPPPGEAKEHDPGAPEARLGDPLLRLDYGEACYYGGIPPHGRKETDHLVEARDAAALRRALRGLNPEGRVYAAEGLLRLADQGVALDPADDAAIRKLREMQAKIRTCRGCILIERTPGEALRETLAKRD